MKFLNKIIAGVAFIALAFTADAQTARKFFGGTSTDLGATNTYFATPISTIGAPLITYLSATSDKTTSAISYRLATASAAFSVSNTTSLTNLTGINASAFAQGDTVLLAHRASDRFERLYIHAATSSNVTFTTTNTYAVQVGDSLWKMATVATRPVGSNTVNETGAGIFYGTPNAPLLLELDGTAASQLNAVAGRYE